MIRLTKSQHRTSTAKVQDRSWYLDPELRFEVHPLLTETQKADWLGANALIVVNGEAHFVDEGVDHVLMLIKIARAPSRYRLASDEGHLIAHEDLIAIGMEPDGTLVYELMGGL